MAHVTGCAGPSTVANPGRLGKVGLQQVMDKHFEGQLAT